MYLSELKKRTKRQYARQLRGNNDKQGLLFIQAAQMRLNTTLIAFSAMGGDTSQCTADLAR